MKGNVTIRVILCTPEGKLCRRTVEAFHGTKEAGVDRLSQWRRENANTRIEGDIIIRQDLDATYPV